MPAQAASLPREPAICAPDRDFHPRAFRVREQLALRVLSLLGGRTKLADGGFAVVTYHRTAQQVGEDPYLLNVRPARFREQLLGLLALGYQVWPLRRCLAAVRSGEAIPAGTFAIVFDDGFENVYEHAFPVLQEYRLPATVFLATAYLDTEEPFPFDRQERLPGAWRPLRTSQCREMQASGLVELGCHTHRHAQYAEHLEAFRTDLRESLGVLRDRFGQAEATFAYPFGIQTAGMRDVVESEGLLCGLGSEFRRVGPRDDLYRGGRFPAMDLDTPRSLAAKIDGWYTRLARLWRTLRRKT